MALFCQTFPTSRKQKSVKYISFLLTKHLFLRQELVLTGEDENQALNSKTPLLCILAVNAPFDSIWLGSLFSWHLTPVVFKMWSPEKQHQPHLGLVRNANSNHGSTESEMLGGGPAITFQQAPKVILMPIKVWELWITWRLAVSILIPNSVFVN